MLVGCALLVPHAQTLAPASVPWLDPYREAATPADNESREFVSGIVTGAGGEEREDVATWFEGLDLDDYASYGGKA